jgi:hypothetical protein
MTPSDSSRTENLTRAAATVSLVALSAAVLLFLPPTRFSFYPRCPIYSWLHLQCPGCGATRALAAVLRAHFIEALHFNALVTLMLPLAASYFGVGIRGAFHSETFRWPEPPASAVYSALALATIFTVVRNLPL